MPHENRSQPMPVKYWSAAGLMLTYWCSARCGSCYLSCGPDRGDEMTADGALSFWRSLIDASPHGCRVHITGGEPFGNWPRLKEICRRASDEGLSPLQKIETNAFWATDAAVVRDRISALDETGMEKLSISADPYHQQFVPIERCRLVAQIATEMLGPERVQVRWGDWLAAGCDTDKLDADQRLELFMSYAAQGRDRLNGRAVSEIIVGMPRKSLAELADKPCSNALLRSKHVHVDGCGRMMPGTCAGIVLGVMGELSAADIWRKLDSDHADRHIVGTLGMHGPVGLLDQAKAAGYVAKQWYASKCQLCWELRSHFVACGLGGQELGPAELYAAT